MADQEGTSRLPCDRGDTETCKRVSQMLARIGDKWTLLVVRELGCGPRRFNAMRRGIGDISQKMLASTLRDLEETGFVTRTVIPLKPPQVEYELTDLGREFLKPVNQLADWIVANWQRIDNARIAYASRREAG